MLGGIVLGAGEREVVDCFDVLRKRSLAEELKFEVFEADHVLAGGGDEVGRFGGEASVGDEVGQEADAVEETVLRQTGVGRHTFDANEARVVDERRRFELGLREVDARAHGQSRSAKEILLFEDEHECAVVVKEVGVHRYVFLSVGAEQEAETLVPR